MTKLSLIMLTNTVNNDIYRMTQNALDSLHNSIGSENFNVVLTLNNSSIFSVFLIANN